MGRNEHERSGDRTCGAELRQDGADMRHAPHEASCRGLVVSALIWPAHVAYLRHFGREVGFCVQAALLLKMSITATAAQSDMGDESAVDRFLMIDYRLMSECVGVLPFDEFALGYRSIQLWYEEHPMHLVGGSKAVTQRQGGASPDRAHAS